MLKKVFQKMCELFNDNFHVRKNRTKWMVMKDESMFTRWNISTLEMKCNLKWKIYENSVWYKKKISLAEWLKTCQFKDPDFFKCSTSSVQGLFDNLVKGLEGIEGLESIDPMKIDRIRILQGEGPVSVNASLTKVKVTGFSKVRVIENQVNSKDYSWVTSIKLPKMRLEGNYHMQGRILVIPLNVSCLARFKYRNHVIFTSFRVAENVGLSHVSVLVTLT
jgi:hypothetical protein